MGAHKCSKQCNLTVKERLHQSKLSMTCGGPRYTYILSTIDVSHSCYVAFGSLLGLLVGGSTASNTLRYAHGHATSWY